jgi:hypothetical protein
MVRIQSDFSPSRGTMEQPNSQKENANKAFHHYAPQAARG